MPDITITVDLVTSLLAPAPAPEPAAKAVPFKRRGLVSLKLFGPIQTDHGVVIPSGRVQDVSVGITKEGKAVDLSHAFIVRSLGGHVFARSGKDRTPINKLFGRRA